jgi:hypothetical protein
MFGSHKFILKNAPNPNLPNEFKNGDCQAQYPNPFNELRMEFESHHHQWLVQSSNMGRPKTLQLFPSC